MVGSYAPPRLVARVYKNPSDPVDVKAEPPTPAPEVKQEDPVEPPVDVDLQSKPPATPASAYVSKKKKKTQKVYDYLDILNEVLKKRGVLFHDGTGVENKGVDSSEATTVKVEANNCDKEEADEEASETETNTVPASVKKETATDELPSNGLNSTKDLKTNTDEHTSEKDEDTTSDTAATSGGTDHATENEESEDSEKSIWPTSETDTQESHAIAKSGEFAHVILEPIDMKDIRKIMTIKGIRSYEEFKANILAFVRNRPRGSYPTALRMFKILKRPARPMMKETFDPFALVGESKEETGPGSEVFAKELWNDVDKMVEVKAETDRLEAKAIIRKARIQAAVTRSLYRAAAAQQKPTKQDLAEAEKGGESGFLCVPFV